MSQVIAEQELLEQLGFGPQQRTKLIKYLTEKRIPFEIGNNKRVWTVQRALDNYILNQTASNDDGDEWEVG